MNRKHTMLLSHMGHFCQCKQVSDSFQTGIFNVFALSWSQPIVFSSSLSIQTSVLPVTNLLPKPWGNCRPINLSQIPTAAKKLVRQCLRRILFPPLAITVLKQGTYSQLRLCSYSVAGRRLLGNSHSGDVTDVFHLPVVGEHSSSYQR